MLVVDVETTGLDPRKHAIASIGVVNFKKPHRTFYVECAPFDTAEITKEALAVNGFTKEQLLDSSRPTLREALRQFTLFTTCAAEKTIAGMNPSFDKGFLQAAFERCGKEWFLGHRTVDLHSVCYANLLARGEIPVNYSSISKLHTDAIYEYAGMPSEPKPHNGLVGARMEAECFSRLIHGKGLYPEYRTQRIPKYLKGLACR